MTWRSGKGCKQKNWKETKLLEEICREMGWDEFSEEEFTEHVARVDIKGQEIFLTLK